MNVKLFNMLVVAPIVLLMATTRLPAQSAYFQAVTNLNPIGYWPMHEVEAAAPGDIETNYGTLGTLGSGYYNDWASLGSNTVRLALWLAIPTRRSDLSRTLPAVTLTAVHSPHLAFNNFESAFLGRMLVDYRTTPARKGRFLERNGPLKG